MKVLPVPLFAVKRSNLEFDLNFTLASYIVALDIVIAFIRIIITSKIDT